MRISFPPAFSHGYKRIAALIILQKDGLALEHLANECKQDELLVLQAIKQNPMALEFAADTLKNNLKIVSAAVEKDGKTLQFASEELQNNSDIVDKAITSTRYDSSRPFELKLGYGEALQFASNNLKNNKEIVLTAIKHNPKALQYASEAIRKAKSFAIEMLENVDIFPYLSDELTHDPEIIFFAVKKHSYHVLSWVSKELLNNKTLMNQVIAVDPKALKFASTAFQEDFVLQQLNKDLSSFYTLSPEWITNIDLQLARIVMKIIKKSFPKVTEHLENRVFNTPINCTFQKYINECAYLLVRTKTILPNALLQGLKKNPEHYLGVKHFSLFFSNEHKILSSTVQNTEEPVLSIKTMNQLNQLLTPYIFYNKDKQALIQMLSDHYPKHSYFYPSFLDTLDETFPSSAPDEELILGQ